MCRFTKRWRLWRPCVTISPSFIDSMTSLYLSGRRVVRSGAKRGDPERRCDPPHESDHQQENVRILLGAGRMHEKRCTTRKRSERQKTTPSRRRDVASSIFRRRRQGGTGLPGSVDAALPIYKDGSRSPVSFSFTRRRHEHLHHRQGVRLVESAMDSVGVARKGRRDSFAMKASVVNR